MDFNVIDIVSQLGYPIAMTIMMGWSIVTEVRPLREAVTKLSETIAELTIIVKEMREDD